MRNIFVAFCFSITLGCDLKCLQKRLEVLERADQDLEDKIDTILVSSISVINYLLQIIILYKNND